MDIAVIAVIASVVVVTALAFDLTNGFHDTANGSGRRTRGGEEAAH